MDFYTWERRLLLAIGGAAVLIIALSFLPWVRFDAPLITGGPLGDDSFAFNVPGTNLSRLRGADYFNPSQIAADERDICSCRADFGDGYLTAALGAIVLLAAAAGLLGLLRAQLTAVATLAASLGALFLAGYSAVTKWVAAGAPIGDYPLTLMDGDVQPALYALTVIAALCAMLAAALWVIARELDAEYEDQILEEEAPMPEAANG